MINLHQLNQCIPTFHFKMETILNLKDLVAEKDWLIKIKDAYLTVPIHPESRKFLKFWWKGRSYQCTTLPLGLSTAPRICTKLLRPVMATLRKKGMKLAIYLDNTPLAVPSLAQVKQQSAVIVQQLQRLGFIINFKKSCLEPKQTLEYLGMVTDTRRMELRIPPQQGGGTSEGVQACPESGGNVSQSPSPSIGEDDSFYTSGLRSSITTVLCSLQPIK